jgi:hypothetical protein
MVDPLDAENVEGAPYVRGRTFFAGVSDGMEPLCAGEVVGGGEVLGRVANL